MKVGIVVFSRTGNTKSVVLKLREELAGARHSVDMELITEGDAASEKPINFSKYDLIVFASPVEGFCVSKVMKNYLDGIVSLKEKKVALLVTEKFPYPWMGGSNTIRQMKKICTNKGAQVCTSEIINWSNSKRDLQIAQSVERLKKLVSN